MTTAADTVATQLDAFKQHRWVKHVREVLSAAPLFRPLARGGQPMRVQVSAAGRLGWIGDERGYRYTAAQTNGRPWPAMPEEWIYLADKVAGRHEWDSAIINWYDPDASLGWHRDLAEFDTSLPIVTISLGDPCSWAVRADEQVKPTRCVLPSGAVTLLAGPTRDYLHTVERIIPEPMFSPLAKRGRVSITIRVAGDPR
jgi:alkylated DNA repair protein (DNA oxidative demethylase)